jgi:hypothetical protein
MQTSGRLPVMGSKPPRPTATGISIRTGPAWSLSSPMARPSRCLLRTRSGGRARSCVLHNWDAGCSPPAARRGRSMPRQGSRSTGSLTTGSARGFSSIEACCRSRLSLAVCRQAGVLARSPGVPSVVLGQLRRVPTRAVGRDPFVVWLPSRSPTMCESCRPPARRPRRLCAPPPSIGGRRCGAREGPNRCRRSGLVIGSALACYRAVLNGEATGSPVGPSGPLSCWARDRAPMAEGRGPNGSR